MRLARLLPLIAGPLAVGAAGCTDEIPTPEFFIADAGALTAEPVDLSATGPPADPSTSVIPPGDLSISNPQPHQPDGRIDLSIAADPSPSNDLSSAGPPPAPPPSLRWLDGAAGLGAPVVDASSDEAQNIWAVTSDALYVLRAGAPTFRRYTNADGLHVWQRITAVAGAGPGEGYVGLLGYEDDIPDDDPQELKEVGKLERVRLNPDGTITSKHYWNIHNDNSANYWETRSARRLLYVHTGPAAGHLFLGNNHGVTHLFNDGWGDHVHVSLHTQPGNSQVLGEFLGLAIDPGTAGLWTCGRYGCGLQTFHPDPRLWVTKERYRWAFSVFTADHALDIPLGYKEEHVGVAVTPDRKVYFASALHGVASWDPVASESYATIQRRTVPGLGAPVVDIAADPDGSVWVADRSRVLRWHPATGAATPLGLPPAAGDILRLSVDPLVTPRALYVATAGGLAVYRGP